MPAMGFEPGAQGLQLTFADWVARPRGPFGDF